MIRATNDLKLFQEIIKKNNNQAIGNQENANSEVISTPNTINSLLTSPTTDLGYDDYQELMEYINNDPYVLSEVYESLNFWTVFHNVLINSKCDPEQLKVPIVILILRVNLY